MNAEQKRAWLFVISTAVCVVAYLSLIPFFGPIVSFAVFGLLGLNGFAGLIREKETPDERDKAIARRATLGGFAMSYGAFCLGCMGTWFAVFAFRGEESVSVHILGSITCFGYIVGYFTRCVAILILYGRAVEADDA